MGDLPVLRRDRVARYYIQPGIHFTYHGFSWIAPLPGDGMYVLFYALGLLAACILVGFYYRAAAALFFLGFTYVFLLDQARYLNHFYLISLVSFLLVFVPAERALSVDALLRPRMRSDVTPAWTLWLLRAQIGIPYFYGGIAKLNNDWLRGEPMRMWLAGKRDFPLIGPFFTEDWMVYQFVVGGLLLDLLVVPLLLWTRNAALRVRRGRRVSPRQRAALLDRDFSLVHDLRHAHLLSTRSVPSHRARATAIGDRLVPRAAG